MRKDIDTMWALSKLGLIEPNRVYHEVISRKIMTDDELNGQLSSLRVRLDRVVFDRPFWSYDLARNLSDIPFYWFECTRVQITVEVSIYREDLIGHPVITPQTVTMMIHLVETEQGPYMPDSEMSSITSGIISWALNARAELDYRDQNRRQMVQYSHIFAGPNEFPLE